MPGGQSAQALVYVPNAVPVGDGLANLMPLGNSGLATHLVMGSPRSSPAKSVTTVAINNQGLIDLLQAAVTGLQPKQSYELVLVEHPKLTLWEDPTVRKNSKLTLPELQLSIRWGRSNRLLREIHRCNADIWRSFPWGRAILHRKGCANVHLCRFNWGESQFNLNCGEFDC